VNSAAPTRKGSQCRISASSTGGGPSGGFGARNSPGRVGPNHPQGGTDGIQPAAGSPTTPSEIDFYQWPKNEIRECPQIGFYERLQIDFYGRSKTEISEWLKTCQNRFL
jgi:hypothetical protein